MQGYECEITYINFSQSLQKINANVLCFSTLFDESGGISIVIYDNSYYTDELTSFIVNMPRSLKEIHVDNWKLSNSPHNLFFWELFATIPLMKLEKIILRSCKIDTNFPLNQFIAHLPNIQIILIDPLTVINNKDVNPRDIQRQYISVIKFWQSFGINASMQDVNQVYDI